MADSQIKQPALSPAQQNFYLAIAQEAEKGKRLDASLLTAEQKFDASTAMQVFRENFETAKNASGLNLSMQGFARGEVQRLSSTNIKTTQGLSLQPALEKAAEKYTETADNYKAGDTKFSNLIGDRIYAEAVSKGPEAVAAVKENYRELDARDLSRSRSGPLKDAEDRFNKGYNAYAKSATASGQKPVNPQSYAALIEPESERLLKDEVRESGVRAGAVDFDPRVAEATERVDMAMTMQRSDKALGDKDFSRAYENYQSQSQGRNSGPSPDAANAFKNPKYSEISFYKNIEQNGYKNVDDFVANKGTASGFDRKDYAAKKKDFDNLYSSYEKNTSQPLSREEFAGRLSDRIQTDGLRDGSLRKDDLKSNNQYFEVERDSVKMNAESLKKNPNYRYFPADEPEQLKELKRKDPDLKYTPGIERAPAADKPKEAKTSAADAPDANTLNAERIQNAIKALGGNKSTAQANVNIQDGSTVQPPIVDRSASINRGGPAGVQV